MYLGAVTTKPHDCLDGIHINNHVKRSTNYKAGKKTANRTDQVKAEEYYSPLHFSQGKIKS